MLHAVVVGVDQYVDPAFQPLACAANDARAMASRLESGIVPSDRHVTWLANEAATREAVLEALTSEIGRRGLQDDDIVLFFYAGHGVPEVPWTDGPASRYLVAHNSHLDRIFSTGIDLERDLNACLDRLSPAALVVIFLDACFSGRAGGRSVMGPNLAARQDRLRTPVSLAPLELGRGRVIMTACGDDEKAVEDPGLGHGVFTHALLKILAGTKGETIAITALYDAVYTAVRAATRRRQSPVLAAGGLVGARLPRLRT